MSIHEAAATELAEVAAWCEAKAGLGHEFLELGEHALRDLARDPAR